MQIFYFFMYVFIQNFSWMYANILFQPETFWFQNILFLVHKLFLKYTSMYLCTVWGLFVFFPCLPNWALMDIRLAHCGCIPTLTNKLLYIRSERNFFSLLISKSVAPVSVECQCNSELFNINICSGIFLCNLLIDYIEYVKFFKTNCILKKDSPINLLSIIYLTNIS